MPLTRREFLRLCIHGTAGLSLGNVLLPHLAHALGNEDRPPVIWIEATTCTGDILSAINAVDHDLRHLLHSVIDLRYQNLLMGGEGHVAVEVLERAMEGRLGRFVLVVEGTIPLREGGRFNVLARTSSGHGITALEAVRQLGRRASHVLAAGVCASFGGPFAANPNPTESVPLHKVLDRRVINVPGCPVHPDWLWGTLTHCLLYGMPNLDSFSRPTLFFGQTVHDLCTRRQFFDNGIFASELGQPTCMYKLGCKGPVTFADCPRRQWNGHLSWPVEANSPCIGCTSPEFPDRMMPFYARLPGLELPGVRASTAALTKLVAGATAAGIGLHLAGKVLTGRLGQTYRKERTHTEIQEIVRVKKVLRALPPGCGTRVERRRKEDPRSLTLRHLRRVKARGARRSPLKKPPTKIGGRPTEEGRPPEAGGERKV